MTQRNNLRVVATLALLAMSTLAFAQDGSTVPESADSPPEPPGFGEPAPAEVPANVLRQNAESPSPVTEPNQPTPAKTNSPSETTSPSDTTSPASLPPQPTATAPQPTAPIPPQPTALVAPPAGSLKNGPTPPADRQPPPGVVLQTAHEQLTTDPMVTVPDYTSDAVDAILDPDTVLHDDYWMVGDALGTPRALYGELDYLLWSTKGMYTPPLVTTGADAAGLVLPNTTVLFGDQDYLTKARSGGRIRIGSDFGCFACGGWELEYFGLDQKSRVYTAASNSNGLPFLGRPFFNINPFQIDDNGTPNDPNDDTIVPDPPARQDAELVSGTRLNEILTGRVTVDLASSFSGAAARWRCNLAENQGILSVQDGGDVRYASIINFMAGYRYLRLSESLSVMEDLTSRDTQNGNSIDIDVFDDFDSLNEFHGFELGVEWLTAHRDWTLTLAGRMSVGDVQQAVRIDGRTFRDGESGLGGLLAQSSNIGLYKRNVFGVVPELDARVTKRVSDHISVSAGYTFIYWSRVARPGEQIDLDVNPELLPPPIDPITGPLRPGFVFRDSDYWAQGLTLGLNVEW